MTFDKQAALAEALRFIEDAGALAMKNQGQVTHSFKADDSIVTETDLAISKMAQERFAEWLSQPEHILLDEESIESVSGPEDVFASTTYQWVLDPIDGTANYANGRNAYGIMLSLLEKGRPVFGILYQPAQEMLVYGAQDEGVLKVKRPFTEAAEVNDVTTWTPRALHPQNYLDLTRTALREINFEGLFWGNTPESAVQGGVHTVLGHNTAFLTNQKFSIWDVVTTWALVTLLGGTVFNFETKEPVEHVNATWFTPEWKVRNGWFFGTQDTLDKIFDRKHETVKKEAA